MPTKLKEIQVREHSTKKPAPPEVVLPGQTIALRHGKVLALKELAEEVAKLDADLKAKGFASLSEHNCGVYPGDPAPSIKLKDQTPVDDGRGNKVLAACLVTAQDRYSAIAEGEFNGKIFNKLGVDVNDYVAKTTQTTFDQSFFLDEDGSFDQGIYDATMIVLESVANRFSKPHPLSTTVVVKPKADFHQVRWSLGVDAQLALTEALPSTISLKETKA